MKSFRLVSWVLAGAFAALFPGRVQASRFSVTLHYAADPGCPSVSAFETFVSGRLGYDPFSEAGSEHVLVRIDRQGDSIAGRIEWQTSSGKWIGDQTLPFATTDCWAGARSTAFALALQVEFHARASASSGAASPGDAGRAQSDGRARSAERGRRESSASTSEAASPKASPSSESGAPAPALPPRVDPQGQERNPSAASATLFAATTPKQASASASRPAVLFGIGSSVGIGMSSGPILLGRAFGTLAWPHLALELAGVASLPATLERADGAGVDQRQLLASAAVCGRAERWDMCLLTNAGQVSLVGTGVDHPTPTRLPLVEAGIRAGFTQPLGGHLFLRAHADGLMALTRWVARLDQTPVWSAPRFAAALGIDGGVRFH